MKKIWHFGLAALALLSLAGERTAPAEHGHGAVHFWSGIPAFFIFFGFFGCVLLLYFAKALGAKLISRDEDYYDDK